MALVHSMELDNQYLYDIGDVIITDDGQVGMIFKLTNACEYMALEKGVVDSLIEMYVNILIYEVIINGTITYIHQTNIKEVVCEAKGM